MNEDQKKIIEQMIKEALSEFVASNNFIFKKNIQILDTRNIQVGRTTGTQIGTESTQKLAVFGATPIVQAGAISAPSGGATIDSQARTAIASLITALKNFGITA